MKIRSFLYLFSQKIPNVNFIVKQGMPSFNIEEFTAQIPQEIFTASKLVTNQNATLQVILRAYDQNQLKEFPYFFQVAITP